MYYALDIGISNGQIQHRIAICDICLAKLKGLGLTKRLEPAFFQRYLVIVIDVVDTDNLIAPRQQSLRHVKSYKSRCSCHQNAHQLTLQYAIAPAL